MPNQDGEIEQLKRENATLRRELALARNHASQWRRQLEEDHASSVGGSNLLTGVSRLVRTNSFARTNTFAIRGLRDVGVGSLDDALQSSLHALFSTEPLRIETFVHPESRLFAEGGGRILDQLRQQLQGASEIRLSNQADNLDRSVDLTLELNYPVGTDGQPPTTAILHMRPFEGGYRLDSLSPVWISMQH